MRLYLDELKKSLWRTSFSPEIFPLPAEDVCKGNGAFHVVQATGNGARQSVLAPRFCYCRVAREAPAGYALARR